MVTLKVGGSVSCSFNCCTSVTKISLLLAGGESKLQTNSLQALSLSHKSLNPSMLFTQPLTCVVLA